MQTLIACKGYPNKTPIDSIQARISKVYEYKPITGGQYGPTTVQTAKIEDVGGNWMYLKVWGHPDIAKLEGQEVVVSAAHNGKGLEVTHDSYTNKQGTLISSVLITANKSSQFQLVAVHHAQHGGQVTPRSDSSAIGAGIRVDQAKRLDSLDASGPIHPATAGAATNKAVEILIAAGVAYEMSNQDKLTQAIIDIGSQIALAAVSIEKGPKVPTEKQSAPKAKETPKAEQVAPKADPNTGEVDEDSIPF